MHWAPLQPSLNVFMAPRRGDLQFIILLMTVVMIAIIIIMFITRVIKVLGITF